MTWSNTRYILIATGDFLLTSLFYYLYRKRRFIWNAVKSAVLISSSTSRAELEKILESDEAVYVAVEGDIEPSPPSRRGESVQILSSRYRPESSLRGVYRLVTTEERHLRRAAGNWYEVTTLVGEDIGHVPACVTLHIGPKSNEKLTGSNYDAKPDDSANWLSPMTWGLSILIKTISV